jgi:hypothetical protein
MSLLDLGFFDNDGALFTGLFNPANWIGSYVWFEPPVAKGVNPQYLSDTEASDKRFFAHYAPTDKFVNVYELSDGTFVQDYPTPENSNTAIPMPLDPLHPGAAYSTIYNAIGQKDGLNVPTFEALDVFVTTVWYGGRRNRVDGVTAVRLAAAGYLDCLSEITPGGD